MDSGSVTAYLWLSLFAALFASPIWLPFALVLFWRRRIKSLARFAIASSMCFLTILFLSYLAVNFLVEIGYEYWTVSANPCGPRFFCEIFDFVWISRGFVSLLLYSLFVAVLIYRAWIMRPRWLGFHDASQG